MATDDFRNMTAYKKAFALAMRNFELTKEFPKEEKFGITDQMRRSSRSVCACVGEAYRKRQYEKYFVSKAIDADGENTETVCGWILQRPAITLTNRLGLLSSSKVQKWEGC